MYLNVLALNCGKQIISCRLTLLLTDESQRFLTDLCLVLRSAAQLGQGKSAGRQKAAGHLLRLGRRRPGGVRLPASRGPGAGAAGSRSLAARHRDAGHAASAALLLAVAQRAAQAALHGGRARGLRQGVIIHTHTHTHVDTHAHDQYNALPWSLFVRKG